MKKKNLITDLEGVEGCEKLLLDINPNLNIDVYHKTRECRLRI